MMRVLICLAVVCGCGLPVCLSAAPPRTAETTADPILNFPQPLTPRKESTPPAQAGNKLNSRSATGIAAWGTTGFGLAVVLILLYGGAKFFRRHLPGGAKFLPGEAVQVLGKRPLDFKQMIYLLRCGSKILIVGSSPQGLTTLGEITEPVEVNFLAGLCQAKEPHAVGQTFSRVFQQFQPVSSSSEESTAEAPEELPDARRGSAEAERWQTLSPRPRSGASATASREIPHGR